MKGTPAVYLGRIVEKKNFRTFVYGVNGEKKLVESWEAYEAAMETGLWFASLDDVNASKNQEVVPEIKEKPKSRSRAKPKKVEEIQVCEPVENDDMVFEVTDGA